jgi:hypothetical protein
VWLRREIQKDTGGTQHGVKELERWPNNWGLVTHSTFIPDQLHCDNRIRILEVDERRGALLS